MHFRLRLTHAYPIDVGDARLMVKAQAVKELSFQHNPMISDNQIFLEVIKDFPNLREIYIGETGLTLTKEEIKIVNPKIQLIKSKPHA